MSEVDASRLEWHDAGIYAVKQDSSARRMTWDVEIFRWDIQEDGDAQPGRVRFEGVEQVEAFHGLSGGFADGEVYWEVLKSEFDCSAGRMRCRLMLELPQLRKALGGSGYAKLVVECHRVWLTPSPKEA